MVVAENSGRSKVGLLGGSFDPPHLGHLILAQDAYEGLGLDQVWFVPTYLSPYKSKSHEDPKKRAEMVEAMIGSDDRFLCCRSEIDRGRPCYSVETVEDLSHQHPDTDFYWLLGADQLEYLHLWKNVSHLARICQLVVFKRPGYEMEFSGFLSELKLRSIDMHEIMISSSEIRERIQRKRPVYMFLHPAVNALIEKNHLYQSIKSDLNA